MFSLGSFVELNLWKPILLLSSSRSRTIQKIGSHHLVSNALPCGRLSYHTPNNAVGYAMHNSRSHDAVIRVYDDAGNLIETHEHKGEFENSGDALCRRSPLHPAELRRATGC
jgi:hypothetical protein